VTGALVAYFAASLAVKAINAILTNAMIMSVIDKQKEKTRGGKN